MVRLLELEPGREDGSVEASLLRLLGRESVLGRVPYTLCVALPRLLAVELRMGVRNWGHVSAYRDIMRPFSTHPYA